MQVDLKTLDVSLTQRSFMTNRESVSKPLSSDQASDGRDAFVKVTFKTLIYNTFKKSIPVLLIALNEIF